MDKHPQLRKLSAIGIIFLFSGISIIPSVAQEAEKLLPASSDHWLYVGGSGPGNYTKIQDAINNASDGDTVFVYHGLYNEPLHEYSHVEIDKKITLLGEDKNTTIINGSGVQRVVEIVIDDVNIRGFTIQNGGQPNTSYFGMGIEVDRSIKDVEISNNIIRNNMIGIEIGMGGYSSEIYIHDNDIRGNDLGIEIAANDSEIYHNTIISHNKQGILLASNKCSVYENIIADNSIGLDIAGESHIIYRNQIDTNEIGLRSINVRTTTIDSNNFMNNTKQVVLFKATSLLLAPSLPFLRQRWTENYWDDWKKITPRPLLGWGMVYIYLLIGGGYRLVPIGVFLSIEFDWHPAQQPNNIPVVN